MKLLDYHTRCMSEHKDVWAVHASVGTSMDEDVAHEVIFYVMVGAQDLSGKFIISEAPPMPFVGFQALPLERGEVDDNDEPKLTHHFWLDDMEDVFQQAALLIHERHVAMQSVKDILADKSIEEIGAYPDTAPAGDSEPPAGFNFAALDYDDD